MSRMRGPITLRELAEKTGVSTTAVSHVLNGRLGHVRVSAETKRRVEAAAAELGYVPQLRARAMATRRGYSVAVLCSLDGPSMNAASAVYFANAVHGVEDVCKRVGYHCLYASCGLSDPGRFDVPRLMRDGSVDGVVLVGYVAPAVRERIRAMGVPCVQLGSNIEPEAGIPAVYTDLDVGLEEAARYLAGLGHRRVELMLPSGPGPELHGRAFLGLRGRVPGLEPAVHLTPEQWAVPERAAARARELAGRDPGVRPTAFVTSMLQAEGLVAGFEEAGMRFPRDYSLVAIRTAEADAPRLGPEGREVAGVTFAVHEVGRQAAAKLFSILGVDAGAVGAPIPSSLVVGRSCGPAPVGTPGRVVGGGRGGRAKARVSQARRRS